MNSENPVKSEGLLTSDFVFTSRTAVYAIRMYGAVGGALSNGRPYPYRQLFSAMMHVYKLRKRLAGTLKITESFLAVGKLIERLPHSILEIICRQAVTELQPKRVTIQYMRYFTLKNTI